MRGRSRGGWTAKRRDGPVLGDGDGRDECVLKKRWTRGSPHLTRHFQIHARTSLVAQTVKHLLTMWATLVQSLGWEGPLEKEMATHSSILAWKIP